MSSRRAAFSKENKNAERSRIMKQRAKLTKEEAATDNKRATNIWQIARALAAEGEVSKTVVESGNETVVSQETVVPQECSGGGLPGQGRHGQGHGQAGQHKLCGGEDNCKHSFWHYGYLSELGY